VGYVPYGGTTYSQLAAGGAGGTGPANLRVTKIYGSQLFGTSASGSFFDIIKMGTGLPTTSGQTETVLPGMPTSGGPSSYDFFIADMNNDTVLDTAWLAVDGTAASGGGIQKWTFNGTTWSFGYVLGTNGISVGSAALTIDLSGANPQIYALTREGGNTNHLYTVTDTGASSATTFLATSPGNTQWRGIAFAPSAVPEPTALLGIGLVALMASRRLFPRRG
jgi:hypothetical protein